MTANMFTCQTHINNFSLNCLARCVIFSGNDSVIVCECHCLSLSLCVCVCVDLDWSIWMKGQRKRAVCLKFCNKTEYSILWVLCAAHIEMIDRASVQLGVSRIQLFSIDSNGIFAARSFSKYVMLKCEPCDMTMIFISVLALVLFPIVMCGCLPAAVRRLICMSTIH